MFNIKQQASELLSRVRANAPTNVNAAGDHEMELDCKPAPITPQMQQQLENEGFTILDNFLSLRELKELRAFDAAHPLPDDMASLGQSTTILTTDLSYRKVMGDRFKAALEPRLQAILPG